MAVSIGLAWSPAFDHHLSLRVIAVVAGLVAGALMFKLWDRLDIALGAAFAVSGLSHLYVVASVAVSEHLSEIDIMGDRVSLEPALWNSFVFASVGLLVLVRGALRKPPAT